MARKAKDDFERTLFLHLSFSWHEKILIVFWVESTRHSDKVKQLVLGK